MYEIDDLMGCDNVLAHCRSIVNERFRNKTWRELYITSIVRKRDRYIVRYGVVLDNDEEIHNRTSVKGL